MLTNVSLRSIFWTQDKYFSMLLNELFTHHNTPADAVTIATTNYDRNTKAVLCESYASKVIFENYLALHGDSKSKIICTAPNNKHSRIIQDPVLSNAFTHFETAVKEATIIILLGIGLASDPHILSLLNKHKDAHFLLSSMRTVIVISDKTIIKALMMKTASYKHKDSIFYIKTKSNSLIQQHLTLLTQILSYQPTHPKIS